MALFEDYQKHQLMVIMNWRMDMGYTSQSVQIASDFLNMGKAYLANAITSLKSLCDSGNELNQGDVLIFPILFDVWHSIELLLKSGRMSCNIINDSTKEYDLPTHHDIFTLSGEFKKQVNDLDLKNSAKVYLKDVIAFISELKTRNVNFDFARYSVDSRLQPQFYMKSWKQRGVTKTTPAGDDISDIIPNTAIDLVELQNILLEVTVNFAWFVDMLFRVVINDDDYYYGKLQKGYVTDKLVAGDRAEYERIFLPAILEKPKEEQYMAFIQTFLL